MYIVVAVGVAVGISLIVATVIIILWKRLVFNLFHNAFSNDNFSKYMNT